VDGRSIDRRTEKGSEVSEVEEARVALDVALAEWNAAKQHLAEILIREQTGPRGAAAPQFSKDVFDDIFKDAALREHRAEITTGAALRKLEALAIAAGINATPNEDRWRDLRKAAFERNQLTVEIAEYLLHGEPISQALLDAYEDAAAAEAEIIVQSAAATSDIMRRGGSPGPGPRASHAGDSPDARRHA
jgi:hypothetical protein